MLLWLTANNSKCTHLSGPLLCFADAVHKMCNSHVDLVLVMDVGTILECFYYALSTSLVFMLSSYCLHIERVFFPWISSPCGKTHCVQRSTLRKKISNVMSLMFFELKILAVTFHGIQISCHLVVNYTEPYLPFPIFINWRDPVLYFWCHLEFNIPKRTMTELGSFLGVRLLICYYAFVCFMSVSCWANMWQSFRKNIYEGAETSYFWYIFQGVSGILSSLSLVGLTINVACFSETFFLCVPFSSEYEAMQKGWRQMFLKHIFTLFTRFLVSMKSTMPLKLMSLSECDAGWHVSA